jgi:hypothetical protein
MNLSTDTIDYLNQRSAPYGGSADSMLAITPAVLDSDKEILAFWHDRELSHIQPQSTHPELSDRWDNIIPEDPTINHHRGAQPITTTELMMTHLDNQLFAHTIAIGDGISDLLP